MSRIISPLSKPDADTIEPDSRRMLDFATPNIPTAQMRCRRRAKVARRGALLLSFVLAGMIGFALVTEPALVTGLRSGMSAMISQLQGETRTAAARTAPFASAASVFETIIPAARDLTPVTVAAVNR